MEGMADLLAGDQITGARRHQEDAYRVVGFRERNGDACDALMVLADGMGGHAGGAKASGVAVATFVERFARSDGSVNDRLRGALEASNAAIGRVSSEDPRYAGMGCTLVACAVVGDECDWISVGDSLLWSLAGEELLRLNADHSMRPVLESLVADGRMTPEELAKDRSVHHLRSAVTGEELALVDTGNGPRRLGVGDRIILASDGLLTLSTPEIARVCEGRATAAGAVSTLLQRVEHAGRSNQDNATVVVYRHARSRSIRARVRELEAPTRALRRANRRA